MTSIQTVRSFESLLTYLGDALQWPVSPDDIEDMTFEYRPAELGITGDAAVNITQIVRIRPFVTGQPWSVFYIEFAGGNLPVVVLRRVLNTLIVRQRATKSDHQRWNMHDLLFISSHGAATDRHMTFAHFAEAPDGSSQLPTLRVLGWDGDDTKLRTADVEQRLRRYFTFPESPAAVSSWPQHWSAAFTLRPKETIKTTKQLSIALARLARDIRDRLTTVMAYEAENGQFTKLMASFKTALIHDLTPADFADMYAQTIAYGLLSTRIANPEQKSTEDFAANLQTNPFLRELMQTFLTMGGKDQLRRIDFDELGINEIIELLNAAQMDEVLLDFNNRDAHEDPVIHFYELFLKEYDAKKRMQRGVFYTPRPVVSYIVRSVHELLQTEFGLTDGLADTTTWGEMLQKHPDLKLPDLSDDPSRPRLLAESEPFVQILDPATGTGTFLVEVIDVIHRTLVAKWKQQRLTDAQQRAAWNDYVPQNLLPRLHAFELMMAPYAIAHMKIGLKLAETGYRFGTEERARIYLTNALEPKVKQLPQIGFNALAHEAAAVNKIKWYKRFTVVIGNPPYSNFGQLNKNPFIAGLLDDYKRGLDERKINLDDDFIKFVRFSQFVLDQSRVGVLGFITNNVFLDGITHRRMRQSIVEFFDLMRVVDLHGSIQKREKTPDGQDDENVFDIKQGVSISIFAKTAVGGERPLLLSDFLGDRQSKYVRLDSANTFLKTASEITPSAPAFFFKVSSNPFRLEFERGWSVPAMMPFYNSGIQTKKDSLTIHYSRSDLQKVLSDLRERDTTWLREHYVLGDDGRDWAVKWAKDDVLRNDGTVISIQYRPFDFRWSYFTGRSKGFIAYPRKEISECIIAGSVALATMRQIAGVQDECEVMATAAPMTDRSMYSTLGTPYIFPLYIAPSDSDLWQKQKPSTRIANFTDSFLSDLTSALGFPKTGSEGLPTGLTPEDIFHYIYAVFHSPGYRSRYAEFLKIDFPRLPLTESIDLFRALAHLGEQLVALHLMESPLLETPITHTVGTNWTVGKVGYADGTVWIDGTGTKAAYGRGTTGFAGVPEEVWNFHIGGYQVCEKWLKDRKGRVLSAEDIAHYQKIVVALQQTIRLMAEIDVVIDAHGGWPGAFANGTETSSEPVKAQFGQTTSSGTPKRRAAEESLPLNFADDE